jgi:hypothetical protein
MFAVLVIRIEANAGFPIEEAEAQPLKGDSGHLDKGSAAGVCDILRAANVAGVDNAEWPRSFGNFILV